MAVPAFLGASQIHTENNDTPIRVVAKADAKKYNLEVLKSPFQVITEKKQNEKKKKTNARKKSVKKAEKKVHYVEQEQPVVQETSYSTTSNNEVGLSDYIKNNAAAQQIIMAESSGNPYAQNGRFYGYFQLDVSYLHGDLSIANQERVFIQYCNSRYGSIENALAFRLSHNWY